MKKLELKQNPKEFPPLNTQKSIYDLEQKMKSKVNFITLEAEVSLLEIEVPLEHEEEKEAESRSRFYCNRNSSRARRRSNRTSFTGGRKNAEFAYVDR